MNQEKILETIINNIRAAIALRGMEEKDFCEAVGVSDRYLVQKRDDMGIVRLISMCQVLNVKPEDILNEGYAKEARKQAIKSEIERLEKELVQLEPFMPEPIEAAPAKK